LQWGSNFSMFIGIKIEDDPSLIFIEFENEILMKYKGKVDAL